MHSIKVVDESEWKGLDSRWTRKAPPPVALCRWVPEVPRSQRASGWVDEIAPAPWLEKDAHGSVVWRWRPMILLGVRASAFEEGHIRGKIPIVYRTMCIYNILLHVSVCMSPFFPVDIAILSYGISHVETTMEGWPDFRTGERDTMRSARTWHTETLISWCFICIGCNMNTLNQSTKYIEI